MRWCLVVLGCASCALPFVAEAPRPLVSMGAGGVEVTVDRLVDVGETDLDFTLTVRNRTTEWVRLAPHRLSLEVGPTRVQVEAVSDLEDDEGQEALLVMPGGEGVVTVRAPFADATRLVLQFGDAVTVRRRSFPLPAVELLREGETFRTVRASRLNFGVRALGGTFLAPTRGSPLAPSRVQPAAFLGPVEGFLGVWFRWFELNLVLRAGTGRLVALEVGVRPGLEALTVFLNVGIDLVTLAEGFVGSEQVLLGLGPRLGLEWAFDVSQRSLGAERPRRFGLFIAGGASALAGDTLSPTWHGFVEGGIRWRWR